MDVVKKKKLLGFIAMIIFMAFSLIMTYVAQLDLSFENSVRDTWRWAHKSNVEWELELNDKATHLEEVFLCTVPGLESVSIYAKKAGTGADAKISISLYDVETGEMVGNRVKSISGVFEEEDFSVLKVKLPSDIESKNRYFRLAVDVENMKDGSLFLNANKKQGIVASFNNNEQDKTNVVYAIRYDNVGIIRPLFLIWGVFVVLFVLFIYFFIIVKSFNITKIFLPITIIYGILMLVAVPVNGVPDESWHLDTAYKYSNYMMGISSTGNKDTIYKRRCDVILTDMLPNDIETGSYYQMITGLKDKSGDTSLQEVSYFDSGKQVLFLNFIPQALGLSIGRLLGLSSVLTYQLARLLNLLVYALLAWSAIKIIPFLKEMLAMTTLLPIMVHQAASFSYDGVLMGMIFLFIAVCLYLMETEQADIKWYILCGLLVVYLLLNKGAVYLPIALILFLIKSPGFMNKIKANRKILMVVAICTFVLMAVLVVIKFLPILSGIVVGAESNNGPEDTLSLMHVLKHPMLVVALVWNTIFVESNKLFLGTFGGVLGWNNEIIITFLPILNCIGLLLLSNCTDKKFITIKLKRIFVLSGILSITLIALAMIIAETTYSSTSIYGLQGRYFVPQTFLIIVGIMSGMFEIKKEKAPGIMTMMLTVDAFIMLQLFASVIG
ncbi:DUF2142 domain-containing protein [Butyrivibrio sp. AE3004]|uniref:DUF2142 domain-containing protein n=1 Tax=Butyrivibrio sp. AE3004 TaxID=1506994 RepID=UPI000494A4B0|nr:DUF2142 domain-containing protein [Butyrivibrio sp. AE3004]